MTRTLSSKCCALSAIGGPLRWAHERTSTLCNPTRGWVPVPFVIFGQPRCGTNALTVFLDSQPGVVCHREIVDGIDAFSDKEGAERPETKPEASYWNWLYRARPDCRAVGWKYLNVQNTAFRDAMLRDSLIRKLLLLRKNKFRQVLSNRLASHHQQWRAKSPEQLAAWKSHREPIRLNPQEIMGELTYYIREEERIREMLRCRPAPFLELWYEDCYGPEAKKIRRQILSFLHLPEVQLSDSKEDLHMNPEPWRELVANAEELERVFTETPHRWMLE